ADRMALAWFTLRSRRYLSAIRAYGDVMLLTTMVHADEIVAADFWVPDADASPTERELKMARLLIDTLSGPFEPERYPDEYRQRLLAAIDERTPSVTTAPSAPSPHARPRPDGGAGSERKGGESGARGSGSTGEGLAPTFSRSVSASLTERLPELHVHLEGTISHATASELAAAHGLAPPPPYEYSDLSGFMAIYRDVCRCMTTADDFERVIVEHARAMSTQHIAYAELSINPSLHPGEGWVDGMVRARRRAQGGRVVLGRLEIQR